jgi:hypothetical protein
LIVAVLDLADGLRATVQAFEQKLRADATARDLFLTQYRAGRVREVKAAAEREAWRRLLDAAGRD